MFKRGKTDNAPGDEKPGASGSFSSGSKNPIGRVAAPETEADDSRRTPSRAIPAYEIRKPVVRTLSSSHSSSSSASSAGSTPANLHVGRGLKLEGKIQSCDTLVIEGNVQATIESESLTISDTGEVTGEATVGNAEINGKFDGTLTVRECLTVHATGRITGTVHYGELKVEQGGKISGQIESSEDGTRRAKTGAKAVEPPLSYKDAASA